MIIHSGFLKGEAIGHMPIMTNVAADPSNFTLNGYRDVEYIVIHYTGNDRDTALSNANYFKGMNRECSAHFFVDDDYIYQSIALTNTAWHCGTKSTYYHDKCRNANSIGIELCCSGGYIISEKTKKNAVALCAELCRRLGINDVDKYVLRHYDITHKICPAQMAGESNSEWNSFLNDVKRIVKGMRSSTAANGQYNPSDEGYLVRVLVDNVGIHQSPGFTCTLDGYVRKGVKYTIIQERVANNSKWGLLKSRRGWIPLGDAYVEKC